jgi:hypothetical protein
MPTGKHTFEQALITLNGVDVTQDVNQAELLIGRRSPVDVTGLADSYEQFIAPNIRRWGVKLNYFQNFSSSGIYQTLKTMLQSSSGSTGFAFLLRTYSTEARSSSNPEWTGSVGIDGDFQLVAGSEGEANKGSVSLKGMSTLTFLTSSS